MQGAKVVENVDKIAVGEWEEHFFESDKILNAQIKLYKPLPSLVRGWGLEEAEVGACCIAESRPWL